MSVVMKATRFMNPNKKPLHRIIPLLPTMITTRDLTSSSPHIDTHYTSPAQSEPTSSPPPHTNKITSTKLIRSYFDHGLSDHARQLFDEIPNRDVVTWTALISGHTSVGQHADAWAAFVEMMGVGVGPNAHTLSNVLKACKGVAAAPATSTAAAVHGVAVKCGVDRQAYVENALLDVYVGGGVSMGDARKLFEEISEKTTASWTTMIAGYTRRGDGRSGIRVIRRMLKPQGNKQWNHSC